MTDPLDPEIAALAAAAAGGTPLTSLTVKEARARVDAGAVGATAGPDLHRVVDSELRAGGRFIPLRTYVPRPGTVRTVVYAHGGGWVTGDLDYSDALCRNIARGADCTVISVDYRRAPEDRHPSALEDVLAVLSAASSRSGSIGVAGDSAGGHLAALSAVRAVEAGIRLDFQALIYPVIDRDFTTDSYASMSDAFPLSAAAMRWFWSLYAPDATDATSGDAGVSPMHAGLDGVAPAYIVTAGHDPLHDEAIAYGRRLRDAGVAVIEDDFGSLCHGFLRLTAHVAAASRAQERICSMIDTMFATRGGERGALGNDGHVAAA